MSPNQDQDRLHADVSPALYAAIHRSIASGYLTNIAAHKEKNLYAAAKNRDVMIWPGSVLFNKSVGWIIATEVVRTSRLFARTAARIDPAWLEELGGPLCKRSYSDAAWDRSRGEVTAKERVTLFGLEIVRDRRVSFGRVDPSEAHKIFVMSGLVEGEMDDPPPFLIHNLALQRRVEALEEKLRRRDILVPEMKIAEFYSARLPGLHDVRSLRRLLKDRGGEDAFLRLSEDDLLNYRPGEEEAAAYPDSVEISGRPFQALYKFAPGEDDDGVTLTVPAPLLRAIPPERLDWGVPGLYPDKIAALIKGLPKRYRKLLVPVGEKAEAIAREMPMAPEEVPLVKAVAEFVKRKFGVDIPAREWAAADVPKYLRMRVSVTDPATGRIIDSGRDVDLLRKKIIAADTTPAKVESPAWKEAQLRWERAGSTAGGWTFGDLPEKVPVGTSLTGYPALISVTHGSIHSNDSIGVRLFPTRAEAEASHRMGVRRLLERKFAKELAFVRRYHQIPAEHEPAAQVFGGRQEVSRAIEEALAREVFERNIRTEAEYKAYEAELGRALFERGHMLTQSTVRIIGLVHALRAALSGQLRGSAGSPAAPKKSLTLYELSRLKERVVPEYLEEISRDLDGLVPRNFLAVYPVDRLIRIPRYLEAMKIRLDRARIDPEKDKAKAAQVAPFVLELRRLESVAKKQGQSIVSPIEETRAALDELRWMIEEFKIALFAPEIKTAFPISAVRLAKKVKEIEVLT